MSKIWDSLTTVERRASGSSAGSIESARDRRCGPHLWADAPVLIYRRTDRDEPFHEQTKALRVNAGGGLITLTTAAGWQRFIVDQ